MLKPCGCEKHLAGNGGETSITNYQASVPSQMTDIDSLKRKESILPGYSVLAKSMIGSGMVGLAAILKEFGWVLGIASVIIAAILITFSLHLLCVIGVQFHGGPVPLSFLKICSSIAPRFRPVVDIAIATKCVGAAVAYVVFTGEMLSLTIKTIVESHYPAGMETVIGISTLTLNRVIQVGVVFCLAPFCYCKAITSTKVSNLFGIACMMYVTMLSVAKCDFNLDNTDLWPRSIFTIFQRLPVFIFAFTCHQNLFGVVDGFASPTVKTMTIISMTSTLTGLIFFLVVMVFPYGTYGRDVDFNFMQSILKTYPNDYSVLLGCFLVSISVIISYPLQALPLRRSVVALIFKTKGIPDVMETKVRYILSTIIIAVTLGLGLLFPTGLGPVMALTGLIGGNLIVFVMPSYLFIQAVKQDKVECSRAKYLCAWALLVGSLALYPICLGSKIFFT